MTKSTKHPSSFRDPSGYLFYVEDELYRHIAPLYYPHFNQAKESGLFDELINTGLLVSHEQVEDPRADSEELVIKPEFLPFISYLYEWSFSYLKEAALLTLNVARHAHEKGMMLKDASAYNVAWVKGAPIWIDTLSFENYEDGALWPAYRQFCEHFLAPLACMAYRDTRLQMLLKNYLSGIPLDLASRLLPMKSRFNLGLLSHLHLHAWGQKKMSDSGKSEKKTTSKQSLFALWDHLGSTIKSLKVRDESKWQNYYEDLHYADVSFEKKKEVVAHWIHEVKPEVLWDLGANQGEFSLEFAEKGGRVLAMDVDPGAIEKLSQKLLNSKSMEGECYPLLIDLSNPSAECGWALEERNSLFSRSKPDLTLALALLHHLVLTAGISLERVFDFFARQKADLIIEFIEPDDPQIKDFAVHPDVKDAYNLRHFLEVAEEHFEVKSRYDLPSSTRKLFWLRATA